MWNVHFTFPWRGVISDSRHSLSCSLFFSLALSLSHSRWQQCSSTCAGGFQRRVVVCQDENGYPANSCEDRSQPSEQRSCESGPCPQWIYGNWGEVRQTFHWGLQKAKLTLWATMWIRSHLCKTGLLKRNNFSSGPQCTKPCGGGIKTRLVVCQRPNGERFNDLSCEIHDKPPDREQCNTQPCPSSPQWSTDPWSSVRSWIILYTLFFNLTCVQIPV